MVNGLKLLGKTFKTKDMEKLINKLITSIGSVSSLVIHTILFVLAWLFTDFLFLTTVVSLEAIYLSILIQLSVNLQAKKIQSIQEDVVGTQETVNIQSKKLESIQENVEEIQEDVEEIQEDVEEINEDEDEDDDESIKEIKSTLDKLMKEVIALRKKQR
jgi:uncharacterized protein YlxW (UPF0749 family)